MCDARDWAVSSHLHGRSARSWQAMGKWCRRCRSPPCPSLTVGTPSPCPSLARTRAQRRRCYGYILLAFPHGMRRALTLAVGGPAAIDSMPVLRVRPRIRARETAEALVASWRGSVSSECCACGANTARRRDPRLCARRDGDAHWGSSRSRSPQLTHSPSATLRREQRWRRRQPDGPGAWGQCRTNAKA